MRDNRFGDLAGILLGQLRQLHGGIGGEIAVRLLLRHLEHKDRQLLTRDKSRGNDRVGYRVFYF